MRSPNLSIRILKLSFPIGLAALALALFLGLPQSSTQAAVTADFEADWVAPFRPTAMATADVNGDGYLDVAYITNGKPKLIQNTDGTLGLSPVWQASDASNATQVAFGDVDLDGDLDLAVAVNGGQNRVYFNIDGQLATTASWISSDTDATKDIAWGDLNGDGLLDLIAGSNTNYRVYQNNMSGFTELSDVSIPAASIALGDMNGDGLLDLAASNSAGEVSVYTQTGSAFSSIAAWQYYSGTGSAADMDWIDFNNDGNLDLASTISDNGVFKLHIYLNQGTLLTDTPSIIWEPSNAAPITVDFGDVDRDGYVDILANTRSMSCTLVCNYQALVALNNGGTGISGIDFSYGFGGSSPGPAKLADLNNDGFLDILTVYDYLRVFEETETPTFEKSTEGPDFSFSAPTAKDLAMVDVDGDGDLDWSFIRNRSSNDGATIYFLENGSLVPGPAWSGPNAEAMAWGDVNGDGRLDLALARNGANIVYLNQGSNLSTTVSWTASDTNTSNDIAWADVDSDGDLDLASADNDGIRLYSNINGSLQITPSWEITASINNNALAWSDVDDDGDLDLAVGADDSSFLILNDKGQLSMQAAWTGTGSEFMAWGDMDNDGDQDLALIGDGPAVVYPNEGGSINENFVWLSIETEDETAGIHWVDLNQDLYPELFVVGEIGHVYFNEFGNLNQTSGFQYNGLEGHSVVQGTTADMDQDGDRDLVFYRIVVGGDYFGLLETYTNNTEQPMNVPFADDIGSVAISHFSNDAQTFAGQSTNVLASSDGYALSHIRSGVIPISYTTYSGFGSALQVRGLYSLNGGGDWQPAVATSGTLTTHVPLDGATRVYNWDVDNSGFFGESDNVVFRLEFVTGGHDTNGLPASIQRPYFAGETAPFRVRGTQIRVLSGTIPMGGAQVYRLPAGDTGDAELMTDSTGAPLLTNSSGYLQGRGEIGVGDTLYAIAPITSTEHYTVYYGSGVPAESGVDGQSVTDLGEQVLNVSAGNPLILFNTTVSLEWDSRNDPAYLSKLEQNIERASEILFDASNGQIALGEVTVHQRKANWTESHVLIAAANNIRPSAALGGVVTEPYSDTLKASGVVTDAYLPGQVRMGPVWSRFGDASADLGEDWARVLAHELGHYYLFLPDNYLGIDNGALTSIDCEGSIMTNPYLDEYSEFLTRDDWSGDCLQSVAELVSGRTDWETIIQYYPWLTDTKTLTGPTQLPIDFTSIAFTEYNQSSTALAAPFFPLRDENNEPIRFDSGNGAGYLIRNADTASLLDDYVISLGTPIGDQIQARGAEPGDRLCVFDFDQTTTRLGCEEVGLNEGEITLKEASGWLPDIDVSTVAITETSQPISYTFGMHVTVTQAATNDLYVQVMPSTGFTETFPIESVVSQLSPVTNESITHTAFLTLPYPTLDVFIRVWEQGSDPAHEAIIEHNLGIGWGASRQAWSASRQAWSASRQAWSASRQAWSASRQAWSAPASSGNGQVIILNLEDAYGDTGAASLQAMVVPPSLPSWLTLVGQAYQFEASADFTRTISFNYLQSDVPGDGIYEDFLQVYYSPDDGKTWQPLETTLNTDNNLAAATMPLDNQGDGLYALISTIEMPVQTLGWNLFGYPVQESRPVTQALASVLDDITTVYWYDTLGDDWLIYDTTVLSPFDSMVNTLSQLEYGRGYWVYATDTITPYVGVESRMADTTSSLFVRPMTVYGWVTEQGDYAPAIGMEVTAYVGEVACGSSFIEEVNGRLAYTLQVDANITVGCGAAGSIVTFKVDGQTASQTTAWSNHQAQYLSLGESTLSTNLYLPFINSPTSE